MGLALGAVVLAAACVSDRFSGPEPEFAKLLQSAPRLVQDDPFQRYLLEFPRETLPNVENFVYWSKERIRKPVVSVVHVWLQRVECGGEASYVIALKHIYDSYFFPAYSEFLTVIPCPESAKRAGT